MQRCTDGAEHTHAASSRSDCCFPTQPLPRISLEQEDKQPDLHLLFLAKESDTGRETASTELQEYRAAAGQVGVKVGGKGRRTPSLRFNGLQL